MTSSRPKETYKRHLVPEFSFPDYLPIGYERTYNNVTIEPHNCRGTTRAGKPCEALATNTGYCPVHKPRRGT